MYKLLLCWRYLLTRYLAFVCIISVMLGVATLIVVNSVMGGFSTKLRERLHGLLSDIVIESTSLEGFHETPEQITKRIRGDKELSKRIKAISPGMEVFAMLQYEYRKRPIDPPTVITRTVRVVGVDAKTRCKVGGFKEHLVRQKEKDVPSFAITEAMKKKYLKENIFSNPDALQVFDPSPPPNPSVPPPPAPPPSKVKVPSGAIVGHLLAHFREKDEKTGKTKENPLLNPGDKVILTTVSGGKLMPVYDHFLVVDYFKSEMSEYDSNMVYVPLEDLQKLRSMENRVTSVQVSLHDYERDAQFVKERLQKLFPQWYGYHVATWEDKQGPLLAAISIERGILNILLFMIVGVAGFGILSIFTMIVTEKTRDIGVMKALGASNRGVMSIFLSYGLLLGTVGAGLGTVLGVSLSNNINKVEQGLSKLTGTEVFSRDVYYFNEIPVDVQPMQIAMIIVGAIGIAVLFSILPALRAAMLHPVRALRYE